MVDQVYSSQRWYLNTSMHSSQFVMYNFQFDVNFVKGMTCLADVYKVF